MVKLDTFQTCLYTIMEPSQLVEKFKFSVIKKFWKKLEKLYKHRILQQEVSF